MSSAVEHDQPPWQTTARRLVESPRFGNLIVAVILLNAVTIGIQTYPIPGWLHFGIEWPTGSSSACS